MTFIGFVLAIIYAFWILHLVNFGTKTATRIAVATELTTAHLAAIYRALPPHAQQRAEEALAKINEAEEQRQKAAFVAADLRDRRNGLLVIAIVVGLVLIAATSGIHLP